MGSEFCIANQSGVVGTYSPVRGQEVEQSRDRGVAYIERSTDLRDNKEITGSRV